MGSPFIFATASELVEITGRQARNFDELLTLMREADGSSIFHHTYQTLREHHLLIERYPNDFAEWAHRACGAEALAESLAGTDLRQYSSIRSLREHMMGILEDYLVRHPSARTRPAREPFYLCSAISVVTPTGDRAETLEEFRQVISRCSIRTIHHHFVTARLRLDLSTNDFSAWLEDSLGRRDLALSLDRIDLVMKTLEEVRSCILEALV
ncbi:MAG: DUF5752 family protein [Planctomycetota bacterium]